MEWTRLIFCAFVFILRCNAYGFDVQMEGLPGSVTLQTDLPSPPCVQDFLKRKADCSARNLRHVPTNLIADLLLLDLNHNEIRMLVNTSFSRYPLLEELRLFGNGIVSIETATFYPLEYLALLFLGNNNFYLPNSDIFRYSENVRTVTLGSGALSYFPNDTLRWMPRMRELDLLDSPLTFINITFCPRDDMWVRLTGTKLYSITRDTFNIPCNISQLDLYNIRFNLFDPVVLMALHVFEVGIDLFDYKNYTVELYKNMFTGIAQSPIQSLCVRFNSYNEFIVPMNLFAPLGDKYMSDLWLYGMSLKLQFFLFRELINLTRLTISDTAIEQIYPEYFYGLLGLRVLNLTGNFIYIFNPECSTWNLSIYDINLSRNRIYSLSNCAFRGLEYLTILDLSDNPCGFFQSLLPNLRHLDVSRTNFHACYFYFPNLWSFSFSDRVDDRGQVSFVKPNIFRDSLFLMQINLDNSRVTLIEIWNAAVNRSIFYGLRYLELIDLSKNTLFSLLSGLFRSLFNLLHLNLAYCKISFIEPGAFTNLENLETLKLDNNLLSRVCAFDTSMKNLHLLSLDSNLLEFLDKDLFVHVPNITNLNISKNQLTVLNQSTFLPIQSALNVIDLSENPLQCSCEIKWLIEWRTKPSIHIAHANQTKCSFNSGIHFRGRVLFTLDPKELCTSNMHLFYMFPFLTIALFGIVSVVYSKRWLIKYKVFLIRLAIVGYQEIQDPRDHGNYDFDLNVIFTDDDNVWVTENLLPNINEHLPHYDRIAYRDDDLPPWNVLLGCCPVSHRAQLQDGPAAQQGRHT